ncbi:MAG TPA: GTP 3',8-cyclase MoaA [Planctomycetaceae bacterium]|nr:GTP 3',8-cyclase MoaA [Planctomycetaceae bacterium]
MSCPDRAFDVPVKKSLVDQFGRSHKDLRISVTDRCNLRCEYCMPLDASFMSQQKLLTYDEVVRCASVASKMGVQTIRLTGGEPLMRPRLYQLVEQLTQLPKIEEVAITTNGLLLADQAAGLAKAGLSRLNVSLDSLDEARFKKIARRSGLQQILEGLEEANQQGFQSIRINAVSIRGLTEKDIVPLAEFCRKHCFHLRFIEFMPLDAEDAWSCEDVLTGREVRQILEMHIGKLSQNNKDDLSQPAIDYTYSDGSGTVGFIDPVSQPFCDRCDRLRLTADGQFRNCLFSSTDWDARALLREGGTDEELQGLLAACVGAKHFSHGIGMESFQRPRRAMYQIGG